MTTSKGMDQETVSCMQQMFNLSAYGSAQHPVDQPQNARGTFDNPPQDFCGLPRFQNQSAENAYIRSLQAFHQIVQSEYSIPGYKRLMPKPSETQNHQNATFTPPVPYLQQCLSKPSGTQNPQIASFTSPVPNQSLRNSQKNPQSGKKRQSRTSRAPIHGKTTSSSKDLIPTSKQTHNSKNMIHCSKKTICGSKDTIHSSKKTINSSRNRTRCSQDKLQESGAKEICVPNRVANIGIDSYRLSIDKSSLNNKLDSNVSNPPMFSFDELRTVNIGKSASHSRPDDHESIFEQLPRCQLQNLKEQVARMPKEWTGPSEYFAAGLYGNQNRKAIFRSVLTPEGHSRGFNAMEFEEAAADLSLKKIKPNSYESRDKAFESREKTYPTSYGLDETMDLSTKWRAPPASERKSISSISSSLAQPASSLNALESTSIERTLEKKRSKSSHHVRMLPRKRLHIASETHHNSASSCSSPDVIVLSDEDRPRLNGHVNGYESDPRNSDSEPMEMPPLPPEEKKWDPEELKEKHRILHELRDELRSEEMKLVLLKKLHQSQMIKENFLNQAAAAVAGKMVPTANRGASNAAPPPLVRSGQPQQPQNKLLSQQLSHQSSMMNSPLLCNQNTHGGPPPLIGQRGSNTTSTSSVSSNLMSGMMRPSHNSTSRTPVTTPPNMVMGYNLHNLQQSVQSNQHQISMTQANPQACPSPSLPIQSSQLDRLDNQTPAQRQAAAKLALRKQLEKTLLQIPPPKPPPPEMHFVPNANNQEFICLLGLEKVVDFITEDPNINRPPPEPFECVQCGTDFSPVWKWQDAGRSRMHKPSVICETCVTSNIKKALKAEHTNRLKTAFVKALQQEQEIEQRMSQAMPSPPPPIGISPTHTPCSTPTPAIVTSSGPSIPTPPAPHSPVHGHISKMGGGSSASAQAVAALANSASLLQHLPKLSAAHQSLLHAQAQQLQHFAQTMPQPQPAHMYPFAPLLAAQAYSYQLLGKNPMTSADLQRQYLLDMIPPRSLPQGSINWKT